MGGNNPDRWREMEIGEDRWTGRPGFQKRSSEDGLSRRV